MKSLSLALLLITLLFSPMRAQPAVPYPGEGDAQLPKRLALIFGVEFYKDLSPSFRLGSLPDAAADAEAMATFLPKLGFEKPMLVVGTNDNKYVDKSTMVAALNQFVEAAKQAKVETGRAPVLLVYFAGHGFSGDGDNYLIPSDLVAANLNQFKGNAYSLKSLVSDLEQAKPTLQIIISDACRTAVPINMPTAGGTIGLRSGTFDPNNGRVVTPTKWGENRSVFLFSTLDGSQAYGTSGTGGKFTTALKNALAETLEEVSSGATANAVPLERIVRRAQHAMTSTATDRWQLADYKGEFGSTFYPFPTVDQFKQEAQFYSNVRLEHGFDDDTAIERRSCTFEKSLFQISEYSYYSQKIIDRIIWPRGEKPDCPTVLALRGGSFRGPDGRLNIPGVTDQIAPSRRGGALKPDQSQGQRIRLASLAVESSSSRLSSVRSPPVFAQNSRPDVSSALPDPAQDKLSFRDAAAAIASQASVAPATTQQGALPGLDVPLDQAVVAKGNLFLRSNADPKSAAVGVVPAGEFLQVVGTTPRRSWIEVKHAALGAGWVDGSLVESALMKVSKSVSFLPNKFDLDDKGKAELLGSFGLLGGVAIADAVVEYPDSEGLLGLTRASEVAKFVGETAVPNDLSNKKSQLFIPVRASNDTRQDAIAPGTVRVTILVLPLDQKTRASIAQVYRSGAPVKLDLIPAPAEPNGSASIDLQLCAPGGTCSRPSASPTSVESPVKAVVGKAISSEITPNGSNLQPLSDAYSKVRPLIKF